MTCRRIREPRCTTRHMRKESCTLTPGAGQESLRRSGKFDGPTRYSKRVLNASWPGRRLPMTLGVAMLIAACLVVPFSEPVFTAKVYSPAGHPAAAAALFDFVAEWGRQRR